MVGPSRALSIVLRERWDLYQSEIPYLQSNSRWVPGGGEVARSEAADFDDLEIRMAFQERHNEKLQQQLLEMEKRMSATETRIESLIQRLEAQSGHDAEEFS